MHADPAFNRFLYASVGEDTNGMSLSVLSAFARQDVDPWEQADALSRLSAASAHMQLVALLVALPGPVSLEDRNDIADRLLPLLPKRPGHGPAAGGESTERRELRIVMFYLALMILGLWAFSGASATPPAATSANNPIESSATRAASSTAQREEP